MIHRAVAGRHEWLGPLLHLCPVAPSPLKHLPIPGLTLHHHPDCGAHTEAQILPTTHSVSALARRLPLCSPCSFLPTSVTWHFPQSLPSSFRSSREWRFHGVLQSRCSDKTEV